MPSTKKASFDAASCLGVGRQCTPATVSVSHPGIHRGDIKLPNWLSREWETSSAYLLWCKCAGRPAIPLHPRDNQLGWGGLYSGTYWFIIGLLVYIRKRKSSNYDLNMQQSTQLGRIRQWHQLSICLVIWTILVCATHSWKGHFGTL